MSQNNDKPEQEKTLARPAGGFQDQVHMAASFDSQLGPADRQLPPCPSGSRGTDASIASPCSNDTQTEDCADIEAVLAGDRERYSDLMRRHEAAMARQMWRFTRNPGERDELVQEVFVEAYLCLARYRRKAPFTHWLRTIAVRRGFRFWKQREKQKKLVPLEDWDGAQQAETPEDPPPEQAANILHGLLQRLKPEERVVMTLEYLEGNSVEQTARLLGWTQAMVKMRAYRAKKRLRDMYERERRQEGGS